MARPPLSSPGHRPPRQGRARADILGRLILLVLFVVVAVVGVVSLWTAGQLSALLAQHHWADTTIGQTPGIVVRLTGHLDRPADAWPATARPVIGGPWLLYPLWALSFFGILAGIGAPALHLAKTRMRAAGSPRMLTCTAR
jgi:type IV secretion system protein VirD4